jgi:hypothetical protein
MPVHPQLIFSPDERANQKRKLQGMRTAIKVRPSASLHMAASHFHDPDRRNLAYRMACRFPQMFHEGIPLRQLRLQGGTLYAS